MKNITKVLYVSLIIALLVSLGGCGSIAKKIANEAKTKISEQLDETTDENSDQTQGQDDTTAQGDTNSDSTNGDSTAITTSDGKGMDWPTKNMGDIKPVSCKITVVLTTGTGGTITFEGMKPDEADAYIADFEKTGYSDGLMTNDKDGILFIKTNKAGDNVWFSYLPDGTGAIKYTPADAG